MLKGQGRRKLALWDTRRVAVHLQRLTAPAVEIFAWLPVGLAPAKLNCSSVSFI